MTLSALLIFAGTVFVVAASPGPSVAALVARVISRGYRAVLPFLAAMWLGEAIWLGLAVSGLAVLAETFYALFAAIKYAGVAYLLYLAWKMWTAPVDTPGNEFPAEDSALRLFLTGFAITMGNPKIMVLYLALLPTIIDVRGLTIFGWAELTVTMVLVLMIVDLSWVGLASTARSFLRSPRALRIANRCSAGIMGAAAAAIAARS